MPISRLGSGRRHRATAALIRNPGRTSKLQIETSQVKTCPQDTPSSADRQCSRDPPRPEPTRLAVPWLGEIGRSTTPSRLAETGWCGSRRDPPTWARTSPPGSGWAQSPNIADKTAKTGGPFHRSVANSIRFRRSLSATGSLPRFSTIRSCETTTRPWPLGTIARSAPHHDLPGPE